MKAKVPTHSFFFLGEGSSKRDGVNMLFGTIDPNVGGWGRVKPNFYNHCFYGIFDPFFLSKISGKFTVN